MANHSEGATPDAPHAVASSDEDLIPGTRVGEFEVTGKIGQGGMGTVYGVVHPIIGKRAAVKVIRRELSGRADGIQRFIQEAQAVNQIAHPNIVDIFSLGTLPDGRPYFVMELLDGENLSARLRRGRPRYAEAVAILDQVCSVLEATHAKGIVHRDLKPDNVFIEFARNGQPEVVKLLDFGIAKLNRQDGVPVNLTAVGSAMGTPQYLSPELARGKAVDARSDVYSLGVIAFELFTGDLPFTAESAIDYIMAHVGTPPPKPSSFVPTLPAAIDQLVLGMLEKDPDRRPRIDEVRRTLQSTPAPTSSSPSISSASLTAQSAIESAPTSISNSGLGSGRAVPAVAVMPTMPTPSMARTGAPPSAGPYRCKGSHVVMAARWINERLGENTFKELVHAHGAPWTGLLLEGTWFDVDPLNEALHVVGKKLGLSVEEITREIARLNALEDLTSMYRFFLRVAQPVRLMTFTPRLWSTYVAFGEAKALTNEPGYYVGECVGIPERLLEWTSGAWRGFVPTAIEVAGGRDVHGVIRNMRPIGKADLWRLECEITYKK